MSVSVASGAAPASKLINSDTAFVISMAVCNADGTPISTGSPGTMQSVTANVASLSASAQIIPVGAKGWTATCLTGTITITAGGGGSAASLPAGFSDGDPNTLLNTVTVTAAAASTAYVRWNT